MTLRPDMCLYYSASLLACTHTLSRKITENHARSQKLTSQKISKDIPITLSIVTNGVNAASHDDALQILNCPLFFEKMAARKDTCEFPLRNDARPDATT